MLVISSMVANLKEELPEVLDDAVGVLGHFEASGGNLCCIRC